MRHISLTPFGRQPVSAAHLAAQSLAQTPTPAASADKWALLRDVTAARAALGVTDREIVVLAALLSFHPAAELADDAALIVFPSNAALSDRAHGMAESTLRRHLAGLVQAGLIVRHDSPNGKRYALRGPGGVECAFGFDLRPLLLRAAAIAEAADTARALETRLKRLRAEVVIAMRDCAKLAEWAGRGAQVEPQLAPLRRTLRRRLDAQALTQLLDAAQALRATLTRGAVVGAETQDTSEMSGKDRDSGRHQQSSKTDSHESEPCQERQEAADVANRPAPPPLALVLKAAPDILPYAPHGIATWRDLMATAETLRPMLGISPDAWSEAQRLMGPAVASVVLACIVQDAARIHRPGGYLRALSAKAAMGGFSAAPMVMALLRREGGKAA